MSSIGGTSLERNNKPKNLGVLFISLFLIIILSCAKKDVEQSTNEVQFQAERNSVNVELVPYGINPSEISVFRNFTVILKTTDQAANTVLTCREGAVLDKSGDRIISMAGSPPFYGYKTTLLLNKATGFPDELLLEPLFGDGTSIGDTITLEWDRTKQTFRKAFSEIP